MIEKALLGETESMAADAPVGGGLFSHILMGILGLLLGLLMIAAALYRILTELVGIGGDSRRDCRFNPNFTSAVLPRGALRLRRHRLLDWDLHQHLRGRGRRSWAARGDVRPGSAVEYLNPASFKLYTETSLQILKKFIGDTSQ